MELHMSEAKRGRPVSGNAMSSAERQKAYRDRKRAEKDAIIISRNASQEIPDDGSPRRLIAELDKAQRTVEQLRGENALLRAELASLRQAKA
jgi:hypothetical protein